MKHRHAWCSILLLYPVVGLESTLPPISQCFSTMLLFDRDADRWLVPSELQEVLTRLYGCQMDEDDTNEVYDTVRCICRSYGGTEGCCDDGIALAGMYPAGYLNEVCTRIHAHVLENREQCDPDDDDSWSVLVVVLIGGIATVVTLILALVVSKRRRRPDNHKDTNPLPISQVPLSPLELLRESSGTPLGILRPTDMAAADDEDTSDSTTGGVPPVTVAIISSPVGKNSSCISSLGSPRPEPIAEVSYESSSVEDLRL